MYGSRLSTYSEVEHAGLLGLAEVFALGNLSVGVQLRVIVSKALYLLLLAPAYCLKLK